MRLAALGLVALLTGGCVEILSLAAGIVGGGIGIYQRYEDRQAQIDQTAAIKKLQEEIARLRASEPSAYFCLHGESHHGPATLCRPAAVAE
jgi:Tfp pilus assembly major pilin PilA